MLGSSTFGFKPSQLRGVLSSQIAEGLRVMALPWRQIRLVSWMRLPLRVVKLTVDGCSRGNLGCLLWGGILQDHRGVVLASFGSFLGRQSILYVELMAVCEGQELVA